MALWWFKFAGDEMKATIEETAAPIIGGMASAWQWLVDAVLSLKERVTSAYLTIHAWSDSNTEWPWSISEILCLSNGPRLPASLGRWTSNVL